MKTVKEYDVIPDGDAVLNELTDGHLLSIPLRNDGNIPTGEVNVKLYTAKDGERDELIDEYTIEQLAENSSYTLEENVTIPDEVYAIDGGDGTADIIAVIEADGEEITELETTAHRTFNASAVETMSKVTGVTINGSDKITAQYLDDIDIDMTIDGSADDVTVMLANDDEEVVYVRDDNTLFAAGNGTAKLTGYVVPSAQRITFSYDGTAEKGDALKEFPSTMYKTVTAEVTVSGADEPTPTPTAKSSGGSSGGGTISCKVTFDAGEHVEITSGKESVSVAYNKKIASASVPTVTANEGYVFLGWSADGETVTDVTTVAIKKATTFTALYEAAGTTEPQETAEPAETAEPSGGGYVNPFSDVFESDWFYDSVRYVYENNMFTGVEADKFDPQGNLTRAMLVTVLYRSEGEPEITESSGFEDVEAGGWYENAVAWAESNGIVMGYGDTEFAPNDNITREQIAAIMFRFAQYKGTAPEGAWAIQLDYADLADISDWASEAVMYCKLKGIMLGNDNNEFKPLDNATRAEAAATMQRFTEGLKTINE